MALVDKDLAAGVDVVGTYDPTPLFAGEAPIVTDHEYVAASQTLAKGQLVARDANRRLVACDPAAVDGTQIPVGILTQAVTTAAGVTTVSVPIYVEGIFNYAAITWPASITTFALAQALLETTKSNVNLRIRQLMQ